LRGVLVKLSDIVLEGTGEQQFREMKEYWGPSFSGEYPNTCFVRIVKPISSEDYGALLREFCDSPGADAIQYLRPGKSSKDWEKVYVRRVSEHHLQGIQRVIEQGQVDHNVLRLCFKRDEDSEDWIVVWIGRTAERIYGYGTSFSAQDANAFSWGSKPELRCSQVRGFWVPEFYMNILGRSKVSHQDMAALSGPEGE
jgi:hypothetical protein